MVKQSASYRLQNQGQNPADFISKEWLQTSPSGLMAMGTATLLHTRRYHSWLSLILPHYNDRFTLLSKVAPVLIIDGERFPLDLHLMDSSIGPSKFSYLRMFELAPIPTYYFEIPKVAKIKLSLLLAHTANGVILSASIEKLSNAKECKLELHPLLTGRSVHHLSVKNSDFKMMVNSIPAAKTNLYNFKLAATLPELYFASDESHSFLNDQTWICSSEYQLDKERGYDFSEDLFSPGYFLFPVSKKETEFSLYIGIDPINISVKNLLSHEEKREEHNLFALKSDNQPLLMAGYPWFNAWGRDTLISVPGLYFLDGKLEEGLNFVRHLLALKKDGLVPNLIPFSQENFTPAYNSIDATFLVVWTLQQYLLAGGRKALVQKEFLPQLEETLSIFIEGRCPIAELHPNGLIWAGDETTNHTWMDANPGTPVTPRFGYAVEVNALWFNYLSFIKELRTNDSEKIPNSLIIELLKTCKNSFRRVFWSDHFGFLADLYNDEGADFSVRPNQIFAASLKFSPLNKRQQVSVIKAVAEHLLTPYGLRTLSPRDPKFVPQCKGNTLSRDAAYHQGTVWPWLLGNFADAVLKRVLDKKSASASLKKFISPLYSSHLAAAGLLGISEIFDGARPHRPRGIPFQAWSMAELKRTLHLLNGEIDKKKIVNHSKRKSI